jgi:putative ABC transport system ATP-binding protein
MRPDAQVIRISVRNLTKTYVVGEVEVQRPEGVSFELEAGEFVAVTGPSGSGKSTFMHILGCLDRPTSGQYLLEGRDVSKLSKNKLALIRNHKISRIVSLADDLALQDQPHWQQEFLRLLNLN